MTETRARLPAVRSKILVVVATKGRASETSVLLGALEKQTRPPDAVVVVGTCPDDLPKWEMSSTQNSPDIPVVELIAPSAGTSIQRNVGLNWLRDKGYTEDHEGFVAFFDDDYRPHPDWLKGCEQTFAENPGIAGITGVVIADGIVGPGLTESEASEFVSGLRSPLPHWSNRPHLTHVESVYGCNMAFRMLVADQTRFDEALPLYAWQEDTDFTGRTRKFGATVISRHCTGVHLGAKTGRTSGIRLGYSQIANPLHIARSGNMRWGRAMHFVAKAIASNFVKSLARHKFVDYPGRMRGNFKALADLVVGRCRPDRILDL